MRESITGGKITAGKRETIRAVQEIPLSEDLIKGVS